MARVTYVQPDGSSTTCAADGRSLMKVAVENLVPGIIGECGGDLSCATCHVFVDEAWFGKLKPRSDDEESLLDVTSEEPTETSRLSCQITLTDDLDGIVVHVPSTQR
ncbi:2Fe-2S iron-sulfur cluster-binding protein [Streptomyces sp. NPDC019937]|uniref:2Fe-2S iron-sulfur cluster-binding protein n=1 Tax=Streptomyces sp. NPDC019937 TaxID=3154787 RepID=UPI0033E827CE